MYLSLSVALLALAFADDSPADQRPGEDLEAAVEKAIAEKRQR